MIKSAFPIKILYKPHVEGAGETLHGTSNNECIALYCSAHYEPQTE